ncbi:MAG: hypothetical protein J2P28_15285 [Actinobacteria bacterium]|nr:hypothetical protein [Actinomycetota bacterium]
MRRGDLVGVVSESSPWHGLVGSIEDFTREGEVMVRLGDATRAFHPQEVDVVAVWRLDAGCVAALGPTLGEALETMAGTEAR